MYNPSLISFTGRDFPARYFFAHFDIRRRPGETDRIRNHTVLPLGQRGGAAGAGAGENRPVSEAANGTCVVSHLLIALGLQIGYNRGE